MRALGVTDENVQPNHGWRHLFKTKGRLARMGGQVLDAIQGHAHKTEGGYGSFPPAAMLAELMKLPRFKP